MAARATAKISHRRSTIPSQYRRRLQRQRSGGEKEVVSETERCVMTALAQSELPHDPGILRAFSQQAGLKFGVYAKVLREGYLACGDKVSLTNASP
jgi:uncharacterized protein YcbX